MNSGPGGSWKRGAPGAAWLLALVLTASFGPPARADGATKPPAPGAGTAGAQPAREAPVRPKVSESQKDFCNLIRGCGLPEPAGYCPAPAWIEKPKFIFDSVRCREARILNERGVGPSHPLIGYKLYRFLGMEYRVMYTVEDALPISEARLAYLLADLPLSARLVSHFRKEPYAAEYLDVQHTHFQGSKGKRLKGDATLISGSTGEKRLFYFGYGTATVAWWTLKGPALMDFTYAAAPGGNGLLKYKMKLLVFPGNGVINGIMNMGLFRKVVLGKVREVLQDITETARQLAAAGGAAGILASKDWSPEEKRKIGEFLKLP